jgi:hypothetical protein
MYYFFLYKFKQTILFFIYSEAMVFREVQILPVFRVHISNLKVQAIDPTVSPILVYA